MTGTGKNLQSSMTTCHLILQANRRDAGFLLASEKVFSSKTSVENTIPPLLNAYHMTRSVSHDKHKLEVMTSDDAFFFPSKFFSSTYTQCFSTTKK